MWRGESVQSREMNCRGLICQHDFNLHGIGQISHSIFRALVHLKESLIGLPHGKLLADLTGY